MSTKILKLKHKIDQCVVQKKTTITFTPEELMLLQGIMIVMWYHYNNPAGKIREIKEPIHGRNKEQRRITAKAVTCGY